jgi:hypothetical protein
MFKNKGVNTIEKPYVVEPKVANPFVHIIDVNMAITRSKVTKEQVFKDIEPIKKKSTIDLEEEQRLQHCFIKTIQ